MLSHNEVAISQPDAGNVITKAFVRASTALDINSTILSRIIGLSGASISRMRRENYRLEPQTKEFEIAVLMIRMFRSLDSIVGGDSGVAKQWLNNTNTALCGKPIEKIQTLTGLMDVISYLDARRAIV